MVIAETLPYESVAGAARLLRHLGDGPCNLASRYSRVPFLQLLSKHLVSKQLGRWVLYPITALMGLICHRPNATCTSVIIDLQLFLSPE